MRNKNRGIRRIIKGGINMLKKYTIALKIRNKQNRIIETREEVMTEDIHEELKKAFKRADGFIMSYKYYMHEEYWYL